MKPIVQLAAMLAAAALWTGAAAQTQGGQALNLQEYWIVAEIANPGAGKRIALRVDCADQDPLRCSGLATGEPKAFEKMYLASVVSDRMGLQKYGTPEPQAWPEFVELRIPPRYPWLVLLNAFGADAYTASDQQSVGYMVVPGQLLRAAKGFSTRMWTVRGGERVKTSDIRLTVRLVTPAELAALDEAGGAKPAAKPAEDGVSARGLFRAPRGPKRR